MLQARDSYAARSDWQVTLLPAVLLMLAVAGALAAWRHGRDGAGMVAIVGTTLAVSLLVTETISLHRIDVLMYLPVGPWVALAWAWVAAAAAVAAAAISSRR